MKIKKEIILISVIIICVVILEVITSSITKKSVEKTTQELDKIVDSLEEALILKENDLITEEFKENIKKEIKNFKDNWFNEQDKLSIFTEHDELEKVSSQLIILEENAKNEEYETALENSAEFKYWLNHFKQKEELVIKNVF